MIRRFVLLAILAAAGYYAVFGGEYSVLDARAVEREAEVTREALDALEDEADALASRADSLENDDRALETIARERFGLIRDGEVLYRFVAPTDAPAAEDGEAGAEAPRTRP